MKARNNVKKISYFFLGGKGAESIILSGLSSEQYLVKFAKTTLCNSFYSTCVWCIV